MKAKLQLSTFQCGTPAKRGQGLRIATTRRPPRGVPRACWKKDGHFDVWFPVLAPSRKLLARFQKQDPDNRDYESFFDSYETELLANTEARQAVDLLRQLAGRTAISIGCYCADESRCHRSRLYKIICKSSA